MTAVIGAVAHHSASLDMRRMAHRSSDLDSSQKIGAMAPMMAAPMNLSI